MSKKRHYCAYPFSQITTTPTGQYKLCCSSAEAHGFVSEFPGTFQFDVKSHSLSEFWQSDYMNWVREKHLAGEPIKECEACFEYESNGAESYRQRAIRELGVFAEALEKPKSLDLKLGNKCNASCLFCDPSSSSRILKEWREMGWDEQPPFKTGLTGDVNSQLFDIDYQWAEDPKFWSDLLNISQDLTNLKFTGGEPLINPYMMKFLEILVESGQSQGMRLQVTTNGIVVPRRFIELTGNFNEVEINFSVDGYEKQNEYIRYPTKWNSWLKNVHRVMDRVDDHVGLNFQHSISAYSLFGLRDYFRWMWPYKSFGFHLFRVYHPEFQQPDLLEPHEKEWIVSDLSSLISEFKSQISCERDEKLISEIQGIINFIEKQEDKSHLKDDLRRFIEALDNKRGISIIDHMPMAAHSLGFKVDRKILNEGRAHGP